MKKYFVYIIDAVRTSRKNLNCKVYYTGFTDNPHRRLIEHRKHIKSNFMTHWKILPRGIVYLEEVDGYFNALKREKEIKRLPLKKKIELINIYQH